MKKKLLATLALALTLVLCLLPATALAKEWDLANGDVVVYTENGKQYVSQAGDAELDADPTVTTGGAQVNNKRIIVESRDGATVNLALQDVVVVNNINILHIQGDTAAVVTLVNDNSLKVISNWIPDAAVHVSSGSLTIAGSGTLDVKTNGVGAGIGSGEDEDFTGTVHITDSAQVDVTVMNDDNGGAAIGSGESGDFKGQVRIDGNANVTAGGAASDDSPCGGAAIGAGDSGDFDGSVVIGGSATVDATGRADSAAIGSAMDGSFSGGSIVIQDNANVTARGNGEGTAIGAADDEAMEGTIRITGNALVFVQGGDEDGDEVADIGMEGYGKKGEGAIEISGSAKVVKIDGSTLIIGNEHAHRPSNIQITLGKNVTLNGVSGADVLAGNGGDAVQINSTLPVETAVEEPAEVYYAQGEAFRVVDKDGNDVAYDKTLEGGVLTITAPKGAKLTGALEEMQLLSTKGAIELRFGTSVLPIAELYHGVGMQGDTVVLTRNGKLTIGGEDYSELLK